MKSGERINRRKNGAIVRIRNSHFKNNDNRKFQACLEKKIELCILDTSKLSYFKEKNCLPYLHVITNIINNKLALAVGFQPTFSNAITDKNLEDSLVYASKNGPGSPT